LVPCHLEPLSTAPSRTTPCMLAPAQRWL
jgi:hypothetical protein